MSITCLAELDHGLLCHFSGTSSLLRQDIHQVALSVKLLATSDCGFLHGFSVTDMERERDGEKEREKKKERHKSPSCV